MRKKKRELYLVGDWDKVGQRDTHVCPECEYLGCMCEKCQSNIGYMSYKLSNYKESKGDRDGISKW